MSEKYPYKNIPVLPETHRRLSVLKAERGDGSFDETVKGMLNNEDKIKELEQRIADLKEEVRDLEMDLENIHDREI